MSSHRTNLDLQSRPATKGRPTREQMGLRPMGHMKDPGRERCQTNPIPNPIPIPIAVDRSKQQATRDATSNGRSCSDHSQSDHSQRPGSLYRCGVLMANAKCTMQMVNCKMSEFEKIEIDSNVNNRRPEPEVIHAPGSGKSGPLRAALPSHPLVKRDGRATPRQSEAARSSVVRGD